MISWTVAVLILLVAALPVTRERLTRFTELMALSVTTANARQVIDHFTGLRRWRLIALVLAVPLACFTNDPLYLVLGWCGVSVFRDVRLPVRMLHAHDDAMVYRTAWLLGLGGAVLLSGYSLTSQGVTPSRLAHAVIVLTVAAAVPLSARKLSARPTPEPSDDTAQAELAIGQWSTRSLYLAGTAIVLSAALLTPGQPLTPKLPEYSMPRPFSEQRAEFTTAEEFQKPTCPWLDQLDAPCRSWQVNREPFPQAAPYVVSKGGAPHLAPFASSLDHKAVVYLDKHDRRMVYQDAKGIHQLTGSLPDTAVPTATFGTQSRYVALAKNGAHITDTKTWTTTSIPGIQQVHDLNASGIVVTTAAQVRVLDSQGRVRMSLPLRNPLEDTYHLRPDGNRFVVIQGDQGRVETFDPETGKRLSSVTPHFPDDDAIGLGLGWSEQGPFLIRSYMDERVYYLDLTTGKLRKGKK